MDHGGGNNSTFTTRVVTSSGSDTYAVMAATVAEWLGGTVGLGVYMVRSKKAYALDKVFASTILIVIFSLIFVGVVQIIRKKVLKNRNV